MQSSAIDSYSTASGDSVTTGFRANTSLKPDSRDRQVANAVARAQAGDNDAIRFL